MFITDMLLQGFAKLPAAAQIKLPHQPYNYLEKVHTPPFCFMLQFEVLCYAGNLMRQSVKCRGKLYSAVSCGYAVWRCLIMCFAGGCACCIMLLHLLCHLALAKKSCPAQLSQHVLM